jgi:hypothetical protein
MAVFCKQCGAKHPHVERGTASEKLVYSVRLLDAAEKSFFCSPECCDAYRAEEYKHTVVHLTDQVEYARQLWRTRQANAAASGL